MELNYIQLLQSAGCCVSLYCFLTHYVGLVGPTDCLLTDRNDNTEDSCSYGSEVTSQRLKPYLVDKACSRHAET